MKAAYNTLLETFRYLPPYTFGIVKFERDPLGCERVYYRAYQWKNSVCAKHGEERAVLDGALADLRALISDATQSPAPSA